MYRRIAVILAFVIGWTLMSLSGSAVRAQANSLPGTYGNEFWLGFMMNNLVSVDENPKLVVYAVAEEQMDITIALGATGAPIGSISIPAGGGVGVSQPLTPAAVYPKSDEVDNGATDRGIHIYTSDKRKKFTCYALSEVKEHTAGSARDATLLLPADVLGKEYFVQTYPTDGAATEFMVVATEANTKVTIVPSTTTAGGHSPTNPIDITLGRGQTLLVKSAEKSATVPSIDLSGSSICADKPIAVFNGNISTKIPDRDAYSANHTFEQMIPQTMWGKEFYVSLADGTKRNMVQVTASVDGTRVTISYPNKADETVTLNRGQSLSAPIQLLQTAPSTADVVTHLKITATEPIICCHYLTCGGANQEDTGTDLFDWGNPTNALIVPWMHRSKEMSFYAGQITNKNDDTPSQQKYFVQIVTNAADKNNIKLDGTAVAGSLFKPFTKDASKVYASIQLPNPDQTVPTAKHRLESTGGGFVGYVYGMTSEARAYEYTLGFDPMTYPDSLFVRDKNNPKADIMSPYSYDLDSVNGKAWYQRQLDWWPIGQERLDTAYVCNGTWLRFQGQMAAQNSSDSVVWKIYKCKPNGQRIGQVNADYHTPNGINHFYEFQFSVDPQESIPPSQRDPFQIFAVDCERYKKHLICTDLEPDCDTLRTMVRVLRAYNDTTWRIVCETDTVHFFKHSEHFVGPGSLNEETIFRFNYSGSDPNTVSFIKGHNIWTRRYETPSGCDSIVTLCIFGCDTSLLVIDTTVCESQLTKVSGQNYSFTVKDKNGDDRKFSPIVVKTQAELRTEAQSPEGIMPYSWDKVNAKKIKSCLDFTEGMSQTDKDTINLYKKHCPNFAGCPDTVKLHITIQPLLYTPEQNPAMKPWCTDGNPDATYTEWKRANGEMVREILQTDTAFENPSHPNIGYFRDTVWYDPCTSCATGRCPKEITTLVLLKVDNQPQVHTVHICRDESYVHMAFMEEDRKELKGWELWNQGYSEETFYEETHGVDVKDDQGVVRCQYEETLKLYIHATYADQGTKFNTEWQKKDTICVAKDPQVDHYEWEGHTEGLPGEVHQVWDVKRRKRVPANNIPTNVAGTFEFVDSLKTTTCTDCNNGVGCDSIWRLILIVGPEKNETQPLELCRNQVVEFVWEGTPYYYYGHLYDGDKKSDPNAQEIYDDEYLNTSCSGDKYFSYTFRGTTRYGCDSTWTVKIHLDSTYVHSTDTFICEGTVYRFFGEEYTWSYDHTPGATNMHKLEKLVQTPTCGCDSGVTHYVYVRPVWNKTEQPDTVCQSEGGIYEWANHPQPGDAPRQIWMVDNIRGGKRAVMTDEIPLDVAGTFTLVDSLRTTTCPDCHGKNGCDSVMSMSLTIVPTYDIGPVDRPLSNESWFVWDDTLFMGSPTDDPPVGVTYDVLVRVDGTEAFTHHYFTTQTIDGHSVGTHECDSFYTLNIIIGKVFRDTAYAGVCSNCEYLWHMEDPNTGVTKDSILTRVPAAGDTAWYHYRLKTSLGFDSIYNLNLTGFPTKYNTESTSICQGDEFVWDGHSNKDNAILYIIKNGVAVPIDTATFNHTISHVYGHYTIRDSLKTDTIYISPRGEQQEIHCDSIWELELEVTPTYNYQYNYNKVLFSEDLCSNETLIWENRLFVGYDYDLVTHPIEPVSPTTPYDSIIYIPIDSAYSFYDSVPWPTGTYNHRCDSINYLQIAISKYDTTWTSDVLGDNDRTWYFGGKGGTFYYIDNLGNRKDRITVPDLLRDIPLPEGAISRDTFLIDTLRLNGCDSIIWDSVFIFKTYENVFDTTICSNIPWSWRPESPNADRFTLLNYRGSGTYIDSLKTVKGNVDSVFVLHLNVQPSARHTEIRDICKNDTVDWEYQKVYYKPEMLEWEVHYSTGAMCDSVMALRATWFDYYHFKPDTVPGDTICRYDEIVWITPGETTPHTMALRGENGEVFDKVPTDTILVDPQTGKDVGFWMTIYDSLHTVNCNCDSTYILRYYVRPAYHFHEEATICSSDTFEWRGMEIFNPHAMVVDTADRYMMADGTCDSIYFLTLHINQAYDSIFYDTICANLPHFTWQGHNLDDWLDVHRQDTLPVDTFLFRDFETTLECDSLYKLYLTLWPILTDTLTDTICVGEFYDLNGRHLTESGTYFETLTNRVGCDSFVVLFLEVVPATYFKIEPTMICADQGAYDMQFSFDEQKGIAPREIRIVYDSLAKANGFPIDTVVLPVTSTTVPMQLPDIIPYVRPNHYSAKIYFDNGTCNNPEMLRVDFKFQVAYPSWLLEQHWMDAIGILNEKYNYGEGNEGFFFSAYQWYKNGEELVGQTRPYLYLPHLLEPGAEYSVGLVREGEDVSVMTCPIVAEKRENATMPQLPYVSVVPTYVVRANPVVNILCSQHGGTYKLYNPFGSLIQSGRFEPGEHNAYEVKLPAQPGVYMFQLNQDEGEVRTVKVIVN